MYPAKKYVVEYWSKFGLRRIDVISTSNQCRFDVVCLLDCDIKTCIRSVGWI